MPPSYDSTTALQHYYSSLNEKKGVIPLRVRVMVRVMVSVRVTHY